MTTSLPNNRSLTTQKYRRLLAAIKPLIKRGETSLLRSTMELCIEKYPSESQDAARQISRLFDISLIMAAELGLGVAAIVAFAITDSLTPEEQKKTEPLLVNRPDIRTLNEGLRNIQSLNFQKISIESENFRQMLLAMTSDLRVLLIRMAMNIYEIRHFDKLPPEAAQHSLKKAVHVYMPFSHRLGLYRIKTEMEELTMRITLPHHYTAIARQIDESKPKQEAYFAAFLKPIVTELLRNGFDCELKWRYKSIPSIYAKMKKQGVSFEQIFDLFAVRIISRKVVENEQADCWKIYSIVSNIYKPDPRRLRDWITFPKDSGYESLHTTVEGPDGRWVEIQIRTIRMDDVAERGDAAHWRYKEKKDPGSSDQWIMQIRQALEHQKSSDESETFGLTDRNKDESIYVLTPAGDVKQLPPGATVLDFAFEIHTKIGATCSGAKVNNKVVPIRHQLTNGDIVEVITTKNQKPKLDWLNIVVTTRAKNRIRRALNDEKIKNAEDGREILNRKLKNWKISLDDTLNDKLLKHFRMKTMVDFYASLATGKTDPFAVRDFIGRQEAEQPPTTNQKQLRKANLETLAKHSGANDQLLIEGAGHQLQYSLAKCCTPIHGDEVFGFVTITKGVTIHRANCPNAKDMQQRFPHRVVRVWWTGQKELQPYQAEIRITGDDRMGLLNDISRLITLDLKINLLSMNIESRDGQFDGRLKIHVFNSLQLHEVLHKIERIKGVTRARRISDQ
ncbi:MAG: TGS domain-containing protein [Bacteroidales bacterium]|nr:TGS domain-containing protein [Bacteroidales bacterium]MDD3666260.1 TGS domain-containing protein [Bacteroidales bacterium]